jgi:hypothetical protein
LSMWTKMMPVLIATIIVVKVAVHITYKDET